MNDDLVKRPEPSPYWEAYLDELKALHRHTEEHLYKRMEELEQLVASLEAKLAEAVEALEKVDDEYYPQDGRILYSMQDVINVLAELKGSNNDQWGESD